ncbi:MAG: ferredoxin family protein [Candidatus Tectomicrobia bacterium]|nr:ferredoxin family protein [Candidatus Tectomicrobia bacterium]
MALKIQHIDPYRCIGCNACVHACLNDVIRMHRGIAVIQHQEDCSQCFACELDCPADAIRLGVHALPEELLPPFARAA